MSKARTFYEQTLGLRFLSDDAFALVMEAKGNMIRIVQVKEFTPFPFTILGWWLLGGKIEEKYGDWDKKIK